ncbi:SurA N-terminal domain-containing protein [Candidatus Kaiserbacteria bacterium]|jgi:parvulin-like peptidyl-prolyl isomerase|nr:SurA N-terminal domain-containing protein [Candidatus Kaiserbacteria bacterium]
MEETQRNEEPIKRNEEAFHVTATKVQQKPLLIYGAVALVAVLVVGAILYTQGFVTAAKVNGQSISRLSVVSELEDQAGATVLDSMISDILIEQAATEAGVTVTDADVATEIVAIESQITTQGGTLDEVLVQQGLNRESLTKQIRMQKLLEALLSSDIVVTEEEIDAFLEANGPVPEGQEEAARAQVAEQLRSQKFSTAAQSYVTGLRTKANIQYLVNYK